MHYRDASQGLPGGTMDALHCIAPQPSERYPKLMRANLLLVLVVALGSFSKSAVIPFQNAESKSLPIKENDVSHFVWRGNTVPRDDFEMPDQRMSPWDFTLYFIIINLCCGTFLKYRSEKSEFERRVYATYIEILTHCILQSLGLAAWPLGWLMIFISRVCDKVRRYLELNFPQCLHILSFISPFE